MEAHTQGDVLAGAFFLPFESSSAAVIFVVCDVSFSLLPESVVAAIRVS